MGGRTLLLAFSIGLMVLAGCATKGQVIHLDIRPIQPASEVTAGKGAGLSAAVATFEDARPEKSRLGVHHHFWGGETYFNVPGGKPGDVVSRAVADYLTHKGWRTAGAKADEAAASGGPDVTFSGKLLNFSVDAESKFGRTEITVKTKVVIEGLNAADGSIVRMTLNGDGSQGVFWFEPEDVQDLVNAVLSESLEKLVLSTKVENKLLRLK
ncbi:MAG: hypothetical protein HY581_03275 [Nitrospirae bacterium]|nr:hypothetical protein [Nitrospirota bacterium]